MQPKKKMILTLGGADVALDLPTIATADLERAQIEVEQDGRLVTCAFLRQLIDRKPLALRQCLDIVTDIMLDPPLERRCRALLHALARGERGVKTNLVGFLKREEDSIKARLAGTRLRNPEATEGACLRGKMPNLHPRMFSGNQSRKTGSHKS